MNGAFTRLKNWFVNIYKSMRGKIKVSAEMKEIFDRLLVTEQEMNTAPSASTEDTDIVDTEDLNLQED